VRNTTMITTTATEADMREALDIQVELDAQ
jgi:hypothetical protein